MLDCHSEATLRLVHYLYGVIGQVKDSKCGQLHSAELARERLVRRIQDLQIGHERCPVQHVPNIACIRARFGDCDSFASLQA